jgi:cytochrome P450/NADPH-cytochrome P450 reductase
MRMNCGPSRQPGSRGCSQPSRASRGKPKTYVQQAIEKYSEDVWRLLQREAAIFVCGEASRMAPSVRQALAGVFQQRTGTTASDAQAWLAGLVTSQRYLEDIWASAS